jgi:hypothetical protein
MLRRSGRLAVLATAGALVLSACGGGGEATTAPGGGQTAQAASGEPLKIGWLTDATSVTRGTYYPEYEGAKLFFDNLNANGGIDGRPVETHSERKSLGTENTYAEDLTDLARMEEEVERMAAEVAAALARSGLAGCTVTLKLRYSDFTTLTRSRSSDAPLYDAAAIAAIVKDLLRRTEAASRPVRLLGVTASNLVRERIAQLSLFA